MSEVILLAINAVLLTILLIIFLFLSQRHN